MSVSLYNVPLIDRPIMNNDVDVLDDDDLLLSDDPSTNGRNESIDLFLEDELAAEAAASAAMEVVVLTEDDEDDLLLSDEPGPSGLNDSIDLFDEYEREVEARRAKKAEAAIVELSDDDSILDCPDDNDDRMSVDLFDSTPEPEPAENATDAEQPAEHVLNLREVLERMETIDSQRDSFIERPPLSFEPAITENDNQVEMQPLQTPSPPLDDEARAMGLDLNRSLNQSLANLKDVDLGAAKSWGDYMQLKRDKLKYQVNVLARPDEIATKIFKGVSIYVNGHTVPTALELRELIQAHGGQYHCYMEYGKTTYTIASGLASSKVDKLRKNEIFITPEWIVDSIAAGRTLPVDPYRLLGDKTTSHSITSFFPGGGSEETGRPERALDARDPDFIEQYYSRSRLHLISTLAQEMKDYISCLRDEPNPDTSGRASIEHLRGTEGPTESIIFHVDLDCFFVSVAMRSRPDLRGKPVAITHSKGSANAPGMSEIASCSYAARTLGMKNGMLVRDALKLCPMLVCLPYQFDDYRLVSKAIYTIIASYTLDVRAVSCDEMFVNFTTLCVELNTANVVALANHIRDHVFRETGCTASVGIGPTVLIARLATRYAKPDGVRWVQRDEVVDFIAKEKAENLPGVGRAMLSKIQEQFGEIELCRHLQSLSRVELESILGKKVGFQIYKICRGEDDSVANFMADASRKSVSCDINYGIRFTERYEVITFLGRICAELEKKLAQCRMIAGSITLKIMVRSADAPVDTAKYLGHGRCDTTNKSNMLRSPTGEAQVLTKETVQLYDRIAPNHVDLRGIGIQCGRLVSMAPEKRRAALMEEFFRPRKAAKSGQFAPLVDGRRPVEIVLDDKSDKKLPEAVRTKPSLFGEMKFPAVRMLLREMLLEEPSEATVSCVSEYLTSLLDYGDLPFLLTVCRFLYRITSTRDETHELWYVAVHQIFAALDEKSAKDYLAPMIMPALSDYHV